MTSARLRKCLNAKCGVEFFKTEGCNKMTCSQCQSHMCYLCRAFIPPTGPLSHYAHFCQTPHCDHTVSPQNESRLFFPFPPPYART